MKNRNIIFTTILLVLACFPILPMAEAVSPAPDGDYPGGNTAEGQSALLSLTTGGFNTAVGFLSLRSDTTGQLNTAIGAGALFANTADKNTATGAGALFSDTTGDSNTANGAFALFNNNASGNTANGFEALFRNLNGYDNVAVGGEALSSNTHGVQNTAVGQGALSANTTGINNTALGNIAGSHLTTGNNNIDIGSGAEGVAGESNTIRIGTSDITTTVIHGISGATIPSGGTVLVAANGQLGTMVSSKRFKQEIKPMDKASETLFSLKPVTFRYKKEFDPTGTSQFGLVAEEVEKVNPDLVVRDEEGKPYSVRYEQVNAMLLNEFLKEHQKVQELEKQVEKLIAGLQKVSAQLEVSRLAPQIVVNNQ
jgi:hypothetical protein